MLDGLSLFVAMLLSEKNLERFFQVISYGVAVSALLTLFASGSLGLFGAGFFLLTLVFAFFLEGSGWQLSERIGVAVVVLIVPLLYLDWRYQLSGFNSRDAFAAGNLSRLILVLSSIKLLQKKGDRDWVLIYLISFFEILLAAGVGISPLFLASLLLYLLFTFSAIILFDIRISSKAVFEKKDSPKHSTNILNSSQIFRLPLTALGILLLISMLSIPLFFAFPRLGGAGFGSNLSSLSSFTGFSDSVRLGAIGRLQQSDEIVMRARVERADGKVVSNLRWRGVALDFFDNQSWRKSRPQYSEPFLKTERDVFVLDSAQDTNHLITQTVYLEPIDTPVLFALARPIALQGNNFQIINRDIEGSLIAPRAESGRVSYKVISDSDLPSDQDLDEDDVAYPATAKRYLQLPDDLNEKVTKLSREVIEQAKAKTRFAQAKAIETYLRNNFSYSLDMKASGKDPLSDFLFNIRAGHCEYFASSLAIMLRTQGIAARIVNGFQSGEYNDTADVYVVKQRDAHSWVEVYFPKTKVWIPFDATPPGGQFAPGTSGSFSSKFNKMLETLETYWIEYVVSYDNQEQRSLFRSIRHALSEFQRNLTAWTESARVTFTDWWRQVRGENGMEESVFAIIWGILYVLSAISGILLLIWLLRKVRKLRIWEKLSSILRRKNEDAVVAFYQRMQKILAKKGLQRKPSETPLEFAFALEMPEAVSITEKYHQVRFGEKKLTDDEARKIENWLRSLENSEK